MFDVVIDTLLDSLKLLPFLFVAFLIIEILEHSVKKGSESIISKSQKVGPFVGSVLGLIPQCGFSVLATNLYSCRVITLGTLISVYLTTSDEMIPIFLSHKAGAEIILKILFIKFVIGMVSGFIIDRVISKKEKRDDCTCKEVEGHYEEGIFEASFKHTMKIFIFIFIITFILNVVMYFGGEKLLYGIFNHNSVLGVMLGALVGMIPNCSASVIICELYFSKMISFGTMMAGLLCGSGAALMVLCRVNKNIKENIWILGILYVIGVISGVVIDILY